MSKQQSLRVTDSNYEAPITTDNNFEEFDFKNDDKVEAENKINIIRSSNIKNKREQIFNMKKYIPHSPKKNIIKTSHQKTQKLSQEIDVAKSE